MVKKLRNEITNFCQRPDESLFEAWECYKFSIDHCPNHNMLPVTQIDTFYNGLTLRHRETINAAAGGTFMKSRPEECYDLIENMTSYHNDWDTSAQRSESSSSITSSADLEIIALKAEMVEIIKNLMKVLQINQQVKAVTPSCETCGGPHSYNDCPATTGHALIDVYEGELTLRVGNKAVTFNLDQTSRYFANYDAELINQIDVIDVACEEDSDFLLEETDAFLSIKDEPVSPEIDDSYYDSKGYILLLEEFLNDDPSSHLSIHKNLMLLNLKMKNLLLMNHPWSNLRTFHLISNMHFWRDDFKLAVQHQRRVHPKIHEVIKEEILKLLDDRLIYPISDSPWTSKIKKRLHSRVLMERTYRRMPFGLCNAPDTFQRCMMAIFHDMIKKTMKVFMDDFSVFVNSFRTCLSHLDKILKGCEDTNLFLNWEKSHFMVKEGIVIGHKILKNKIEVDNAKVDVIAKLPHLTTLKGIRSFLGHAGFYCRFI
nr:reverse transcriptase domain-containing protein [Tanacetum cinerariifolium]